MPPCSTPPCPSPGSPPQQQHGGPGRGGGDDHIYTAAFKAHGSRFVAPGGVRERGGGRSGRNGKEEEKNERRIAKNAGKNILGGVAM
jgi:hypothetical protein